MTIVDSDGVDATWSTSCDEIKKRGRYATSSLSEEESEFPIAFARIVYKVDYHLQELLLNIMYAPQNIFCYAVDAKAPLLFREQIANLSNCFPNVFLTTQQFQVDSAGHNTTRSFLECLRLLNSKPKWKYAILLQVLNGSNDINVGPPNKGRIPRNMNWTYRALNLFQDSSKNDNRVLEIAKGSTSVSLSRSFVKFVVDELNLTTLVDRFESMEYGIDEMIFPSLHADDQLDAPGGFTRHCIGKYNNLITRYVSWQRTSSGKPRPCFSGRYRHEICVFGLADLSTLSTSKSLFANKMMPEYDYGAIACWLKTLARRRHTRFHTDASRNDYYSQRLPVRFHNERAKWRKNLDAFDCEA
ncbi:unnamed protein product [Toxocara canis]|uniref:Core-2/I-Branching enzyme n=1 Tax=Toxocara canis TaxID=6265 RepID=A0A3P7GF52_TOXCA|nr:unnamed protein product [Toxocara canis]